MLLTQVPGWWCSLLTPSCSAQGSAGNGEEAKRRRRDGCVCVSHGCSAVEEHTTNTRTPMRRAATPTGGAGARPAARRQETAAEPVHPSGAEARAIRGEFLCLFLAPMPQLLLLHQQWYTPLHWPLHALPVVRNVRSPVTFLPLPLYHNALRPLEFILISYISLSGI